jgi:TATA-box binding protein (TBP) (component of TFIID and TFIIIB)
MFANLFEDKKPQEIEISADGISLDLLRAVYRNNQLPLTIRMRAAIAALPFESPKLAVTAMVSEQDFATLLDQRLKRMEAMRTDAIEARPQPQVEVKPPMSRIADGRYRRTESR